MALVLETTLRNALADDIDANINFGVSDANGDLKFETSGDVEVATIEFQDPAFGPAATGVITAAGLPLSDTSATGGTVAQYSIFNRNNLKILEGVVSVSGDDLDLSSLSVGVGDTVELTAFTITVPA